jgi:polysaccharide chain length determinant protein (PEP-CTERM system associated)
MEETRFHALDYLSVFRRRVWWLVLPIAASVIVGAALVRFLPKQYRAATTLGVAAPMVSPSLVNQANSLDNQERLRAISQQMLSLAVLERVIKEEGLGPGGPNDPQVAKMRKAIEITVPEPVANFNEPRRLDTFVVGYSDEQPARAQRMANRLATVFVDANSETRAERAEDTSAFIATQLRASQGRLADLEQRLRKSKEAHMGRLPEQTAANLQNLTGLRQQLEANATALRGEQDRLSMIERQIDAMRQGNQQQMMILAQGKDLAQPPEMRITALERELASARATYTDKHPEVQRLQEDLARARREAAADKQRPEQDRLALLGTDPSYRQLIGDREMARLRVRDLQRGGTDVQHQIALYQARVEAAPMVEQQLATVQRDYDLEKLQYADLSAKLRTATIAENVERNRGGEQFMVLYPAALPLEPTKPIPLRVMLMSILCGIGLGVALTLGREYFDRSVHDVRELKDEFGLPVLGEVARIQTA